MRGFWKSFVALDSQKRRLLLITTFSLFLAAWMVFFKVETVAVADGKVIPSSMVKVIQNFEGGIVREIFVTTGDRIKKGDLLFTFDPLTYRNEFEAVEKQITYLAIRLERFTAEMNGVPLVFSLRLTQGHGEQVSAEQREYVARQIRLRELESLLALAEEERTIASRLVAKGLEPKSELLRAQRQETERRQMIQSLREEATAQATQIRGEIQVKLNALSTLSDKLNRTEVRAPEDGVIGSVAVTTVGGSVKPGDPLAQLVPTESEMLIEVRLMVADIATVAVGSKARISLTAYDSDIFGSLDAEVVAVSPDAVMPENGPAFYVVRMKTLHILVDDFGRELAITPGMSAQARIITGQRTFLEYIFKPISRLMSNSFREG